RGCRASGPRWGPAGSRADSIRHASALHERALLHALEKPKRRALGLLHRIHRQEKRLLELILPGDRGMAHAIGEGDPGRAGGKIDGGLRRFRLVLEIGFHPVVELQHQRVVRRAARSEEHTSELQSLAYLV